MPTMYDRLGDLLNETLEAGAVKFVRVERTEESPPQQFSSAETIAAEAEEKKQEIPQTKKRRDVPRPERSAPAIKKYIYRKLTPELERAYRLLDITVSATMDDVKKAYKEKLKFFHPDRYAGNEVLVKVATDKTREIVSAYTQIQDFLEP